MADYNRNDRPSRGGGRGGNTGGFKRRDFDDRASRGPVEMHKAICDECGNECQVPFRPTGGKPVYCSNCFEKKSSQSGRSDSRDWNPRRSSDEREMFEAVCDNCGKNCKIPFRPTGSRPVYCSDCFEKGNNTPGNFEPRNSESRDSRELRNTQQPQHSAQIQELNAKLDRILELLSPSSTFESNEQPAEEIKEEDSEVEITAPKAAKKKKPSKKTEFPIQ